MILLIWQGLCLPCIYEGFFWHSMKEVGSLYEEYGLLLQKITYVL